MIFKYLIVISYSMCPRVRPCVKAGDVAGEFPSSTTTAFCQHTGSGVETLWRTG